MSFRRNNGSAVAAAFAPMSCNYATLKKILLCFVVKPRVLGRRSDNVVQCAQVRVSHTTKERF
jgi:hypothetical protein